MLQPYSRNRQTQYTAPKPQGGLKPFKAVVQAPQRPDIRQSEVYKNAVAGAEQAKKESDYANSKRGFLMNTLKAAPQAAWDITGGNIARLAGSAVQTPIDVAKGQHSQDKMEWMKKLGFTPTKTFQADIANTRDDVIQGKKGLSSLAWDIAQVPLAGAEALGVGRGLTKGVQAYQGASGALQGIKKAAPEVLDAFIPTTRGLKPFKKVTPAQELIQTPQIMRNKISQTGGQVPNSVVELKSSYKPSTIQNLKTVNKVETPIQTELLSKKAEAIINRGETIGKERGHIAKIANSENVSIELGKRLRENPDSYIQTRHQEPLVKEAQRTIFDNPQEAERIATQEISDRATIMSDELAMHYDSIAQQAKKAGDEAGFEQAMQKAVDISLRGSKNLSESARALVAAKRIDMLSPNGVIDYVNKVVKSVGEKGLTLSNEKYFDIIRKAEEVKNILDPKQKALATFDLLDDIYSDIPKSSANKVSEILNLPRAMMATADLSAPLRQGLFTMARNPKTFAKNFGSMFKYAFSEDAYRNLKADIITSPNYNLYVKHKLPLTDISTQLTGREEQFMSQLADKIPGFGKLAKGSNRAYSGFLNKMRMDLFDDFVKTGKQAGIDDPKYLESASEFVGSATGRGKLHESIEPHAALLNSIFFSPRLMASRFNLINPKYYIDLHPAVRKEALKTAAAFVGTGASILGLSSLAGAEVGTDPRSADFGKMKIGDTRFDTWGGFQQYAVLMSRLISGESVSSTTGKETSLTEGGYNPTTRGTIIQNFLQNKQNPIMSFLTGMMTGKDGLDDFKLAPSVVDMFIPMIAQDAFDLQREYGIKGIAMAVPGAFGVGSQTYSDQIPMFTETASGNVGLKYRQQPDLGEAIINGVTGTELSNVPQEHWAALAEERLAEQKRQIELTKAKSLVLASGESQQVGDTYIYLDNGVVKTKKQSKEKRLPLKDQLLYQQLEEKKANSKAYYQ